MPLGLAGSREAQADPFERDGVKIEEDELPRSSTKKRTPCDRASDCRGLNSIGIGDQWTGPTA